MIIIDRKIEVQMKAGVGIGQEYVDTGNTSTVSKVKIVVALTDDTTFEINNPNVKNAPSTFEHTIGYANQTFMIDCESITVSSGKAMVYAGVENK